MAYYQMTYGHLTPNPATAKEINSLRSLLLTPCLLRKTLNFAMKLDNTGGSLPGVGVNPLSSFTNYMIGKDPSSSLPHPPFTFHPRPGPLLGDLVPATWSLPLPVELGH
jgi:hypothetical protein